MDEKTFNLISNLGSVVLGWVLGIGSAALSTWWSNRNKLRATKDSIFIELEEVAQRLMYSVYYIESKRGKFDRELLTWFQAQLDAYKGVNKVGRLPEAISGLLTLNDADLAQITARQTATSGDTSSPRESAPYSEAAMAQSEAFDPKFAAQLMDILANLRILEDCREASLYYLRLTFDGTVTPDNHQRAQANLNASDAKLSQVARRTVDKIAAFRRGFDPRVTPKR
jgi:hypothetical protein